MELYTKHYGGRLQLQLKSLKLIKTVKIQSKILSANAMQWRL